MPPELRKVHGTDRFFGFIEEFLVAVPSYRDSLSNMIADGDKVAYISTMTGTQTGPLGDLPKQQELHAHQYHHPATREWKGRRDLDQLG